VPDPVDPGSQRRLKLAWQTLLGWFIGKAADPASKVRRNLKPVQARRCLD
jgi:hypothetical protein